MSKLCERLLQAKIIAKDIFPFSKSNSLCSNRHKKGPTEVMASIQHIAEDLEKLNSTIKYRSSNTEVKL